MEETPQRAILIGETIFFLFLPDPLIYRTSRLLTTPTSTSWVTRVPFLATPMNWKYTCTVCGHYSVYCLCHSYNSVYNNTVTNSLQCTLQLVFRVQYNNNIVSTMTYTLFIIVMFLIYYYILKLYFPPPGGEESLWTNASHWRHKFYFQIFPNFLTPLILVLHSPLWLAIHG